MEPKVGLRFVQTMSKPWTVDGVAGNEAETLLCEIEAVDEAWIDYRVVEVLSVENPCPAGASNTTGGRLAQFMFTRRARQVQ